MDDPSDSFPTWISTPVHSTSDVAPELVDRCLSILSSNHDNFHRMKVLILLLPSLCQAWSSSSQPSGATTRREALWKGLAGVAALTSSSLLDNSLVVPPVWAMMALDEGDETKKIGISNEELAKIIARDIQENQFMVAADVTRSVYDESATFTDEIDTYEMDAWIRGTKRLFVASKSHVDMVPDSLHVTDTEATFRFTEDLTFNIPLLQPKVYLSGLVILKRDPKTGLIISYQEKWDQDVNTVLKSAKFGG